jgi:hypothetical protein
MLNAQLHDTTPSRAFHISNINKHRVTGCFNLQLTTPYHDLLTFLIFNKHRVTGCFNLQLTTPYHDLLNITIS